MSEALRTVDLPAAAIALIKEGAPKAKANAGAISSPINELPSLEPTASPPGGSPPDAELDDAQAVAEGRRSTKPKPARDLESEAMGSANCVSMTVRVPAELPNKLLRAATDRKIAKVRPFTQQGMVADALAQWLKKNGY